MNRSSAAKHGLTLTMKLNNSLTPAGFNKVLAETLKNDFEEFKAPEWIAYVKTGAHRERPTQDENFWYNRSASILRQIHKKGILGVSRLRSRYGGRKDNGMAPAHFQKSGGKIIRLILQQGEAAGLLEKAKGKKVGRQLTSKGKQLLENIQ